MSLSSGMKLKPSPLPVEYKVEPDLTPHDFEKRANALGKTGWRLHSFIVDGWRNVVAVFVRELKK